MRILDIGVTAVRNIRRTGLRSGLSLLGIAIGVFAVTLMVSLGLGLRGYVAGQLEAFGRDLIAIAPSIPGASHRGSATGQLSGLQVRSLTLDDVDRLRDRSTFPYVTAVSAQRVAQEYVTAEGKDIRSMIIGVSWEYPEVDPQTKVGKGRFFRESEELEYAAVAVLGASLAEKLFGETDPLGRKVRVGNLSMTVVGVAEPRGSVAFFDLDSVLYAPITVTLKKIVGVEYLQEIDVKVGGEENLARAEDDITRLMRKWHGVTDPDKDDFHLHTSTGVLDQVNTVTGAITILLGFLAAISLLVGGIGIMNIMLVSVTERIREVGLRKALGARNGDIMLQFLAESVLLTTFGGLFGGFLAVLATLILVTVARNFGVGVPYVVSLPAFFAAAAVSASIGIVFGLYPAKKAASQDPITALRYE